MQQYSIKKHKKELKRKRKRKIVRLERLRESISKRQLAKALASPR
jgi:Zn-finger domain-containing protein